VNEREKELRRIKIRKMLDVDIWDYQNVSIHGDAFRHFVVKSAIYKLLSEAGHDNVFTELPFPNGRIADVLDTETGLVYEVETDMTASDQREKEENFWDFQGIRDVIVIDPSGLPENLKELRSELKSELVL